MRVRISFQDQVLLCKNTEEIHSLFLILAEPGGSALIKPIISLEFFLPKPNIPIIQPSQDALQLVGSNKTSNETSL